MTPSSHAQGPWGWRDRTCHFHLRQRYAHDCGVAAAAIVAGVSYEEAKSVAQSRMTERGIAATEMVPILERLTGRGWRMSLPWRPRLKDYRLPAGFILLALYPPWRPWRLHCVAVRGCLVFDPALDHPHKIKTYSFRHCRIFLVYHPISHSGDSGTTHSGNAAVCKSGGTWENCGLNSPESRRGRTRSQPRGREHVSLTPYGV
jgi:hypothetical protein